MTDWTPGDGWREITRKDPLDLPYVAAFDEEGNSRYWVRVAPVPPLPTEPYTVIRVSYDPAKTQYEFCLWPDYGWWSKDGGRLIEERITGFEVLAEPREVTAKAVLDRIRAEGLIHLILKTHPGNAAVFDAIAREFGVES